MTEYVSCCLKYCYLLGVKMYVSHAYEPSFWYLLGRSSKLGTLRYRNADAA